MDAIKAVAFSVSTLVALMISYDLPSTPAKIAFWLVVLCAFALGRVSVAPPTPAEIAGE